jgi:uncharacterized protein YacL (UPF0231 family)
MTTAKTYRYEFYRYFNNLEWQVRASIVHAVLSLWINDPVDRDELHFVRHVRRCLPFGLSNVENIGI